MNVSRMSNEWVSDEIREFLNKYKGAGLDDLLRKYKGSNRYKESTLRTQYGRVRGSIKTEKTEK